MLFFVVASKTANLQYFRGKIRARFAMNPVARMFSVLSRSCSVWHEVSERGCGFI
jgi:hypothetical protein